MSLHFKQSRKDTAVGRMYPNAKTTVIARTDVSNKNLLKNPFNNLSDPPDDPGLRPFRKTTDNFGNVFATSTVDAPRNITNLGLLQNPWRFREDPVDEPRTLSLQVIKDINKGKLPRYIREDKGIDQIAYMILEYLSDNGIKLVTIALLKSFITGHRLHSLLDKGSQHVSRAFTFFSKLMDAARKLYKQGVLADKMDNLIQDYVDGLYDVYGDIVMKNVSHLEIKAGLQELGALSGVLSRLFRTQNALEPQRLVPYEQLVGLPPNPTPPIPINLGDNEPSPPQSIKEPDNVADQNNPLTPANPSNTSMIAAQVGSATPNSGVAPPVPVESSNNIIRKAVIGAVGVAVIGAGMYGLYKYRQVPGGAILAVPPAVRGIVPFGAGYGGDGDGGNGGLGDVEMMPLPDVRDPDANVPMGRQDAQPPFQPDVAAAAIDGAPRERRGRRGRKVGPPTEAGPALDFEPGSPEFIASRIKSLENLNYFVSEDDSDSFLDFIERFGQHNLTLNTLGAFLNKTPPYNNRPIDRDRLEAIYRTHQRVRDKTGRMRAIWDTLRDHYGMGKKSKKQNKSKKPKASKNIDSQILALLKG